DSGIEECVFRFSRISDNGAFETKIVNSSPFTSSGENGTWSRLSPDKQKIAVAVSGHLGVYDTVTETWAILTLTGITDYSGTQGPALWLTNTELFINGHYGWPLV